MGTTGERRAQRGAANPEAGTGAPEVIDAQFAREVADPAKQVPGRLHAESLERGQRSRHQPLAAGFVDRWLPRLQHHHSEPGETRFDGGREADGSCADDEHVDIRAARGHRTGLVLRAVSVPSARSSVGMRKRSSRIAFSTVNVNAVTHALCTSGSAIPSTTTMK